MLRRWTLASLLLLASCRQILGVEPKEIDAFTRCLAFPAGDALLRLSHASPAVASAQLCLRRSPGGPFWPLMAQGDGCHPEIPYGQATVLVGLTGGEYEVRVADASKGCGEGVAEGKVTLVPGQVTEVWLAQREAGKLELSSWTTAPPGAGKLRVLHDARGVDDAELHDGEKRLGAAGAQGYTDVEAASGELRVVASGEAVAMLPGPLSGYGMAVLAGGRDNATTRPRLAACKAQPEGGELTRCKQTSGPTLVVETINVYQGNTDYFTEERLPALLEALKASPAEVFCLQEIPRVPELRGPFLDALRSIFPQVVHFETDLSTPVDSPNDIEGKPPAELASPPCAGFEEEVDGFLSCAKQACSTIPGSEQGKLTSEKCFLDACASDILTLVNTREKKICGQCLRTVIPYRTLGESRDICATAKKMPLSLWGENSNVIASRVPLASAERWVLPATGEQRVIVYAQIAREGAEDVDLHCTRLGTIYDGPYAEYNGPYGEGQPGTKGWASEQKLQATKVQEYIAGRSRDRRVIFAGWLGASREVKDGKKIIIEGYGQETLSVLDSLLVSASSPERQAECTACLANPLYDDSFFDRRTDHFYLRGFDLGDVDSLEVVEKASTVVVTPNAQSKGKGLVPVSDHYGLRLSLRLTR